MKKVKLSGVKYLFLLTIVFVMLQSNKVYAYDSISFNSNYSGTLSAGGVKWYEFTTLDGYKSYTVTFNGVRKDNWTSELKVGVYDSTNALIYVSDSSNYAKEQYTVKLEPSEKYYIKLTNTDGYDVQGYAFKVTYADDVADKKEDAQVIDLSTITNSDICAINDVDFYKFTTPDEDLRYDIKFASNNGYLNIYVLDERDKVVAKDTFVGSSGSTIYADLKANNTYYIKVSTNYDDAGTYSIQAITRRPSYHWSSDYSDCSIHLTNTANSSDITYLYGYVTTEEEIESTCKENGKKVYKAKDSIWDDNYNYCDIKEVILPKKEHSSETDYAVAATCTQAGKTEGSHCSICGTVIVAQQIIPATGHNVVQDAAVEATCTKSGKTAGSHCATCGTVISAQQTVAKTAHKWTSWKVVKKPTVTSTGRKKRSCSICGDVKYAQIAKVKIKNVNIKKGKSKTILFNVLDKGDSIKKVTVDKNSKVKIKKIKNNKYQFTGSKKGTYKVTVTLKSNKKFTFKVVIK